LRAFLDASLLLDVLEDSARGRRFISTLTTQRQTWCVSPLVRMECRVRALQENDQAKLAALDAITAPMLSLTLVPEVFERAAVLRARLRLKTPDALHVATALEHGCSELWTADVRLSNAAIPDLPIRLVS
jgi:predicted nucleic acid-binding protein